MISSQKRFVRSDWITVGGAVVWLLFITVVPRSALGVVRAIENLLMLAVLVHLPLALGLLYRPGDPTWGGDPLHFAQRFQPVAAFSMLIALMLPDGLLSFLLVLPWLTITLSMALSALQWLSTNRWRSAHQLLFCAGLLFLPIGASWLAAYRLGFRPLGFADPIVLLTAVHFHYTGFVLPIFGGLLGKWMTSSNLRNSFYPWAAAGVIVAIPLIAAGISLSPTLEMVGVLLLAVAVGGLLVVLTMTMLPWLTVRLARELLLVAALSLLLAISLGMVYGVSQYFGAEWLTIPQMVTFHGWLNGVGFALCGLLGWRILMPPAAADGTVLLEQTW